VWLQVSSVPNRCGDAATTPDKADRMRDLRCKPEPRRPGQTLGNLKRPFSKSGAAERGGEHAAQPALPRPGDTRCSVRQATLSRANRHDSASRRPLYVILVTAGHA